MNRYRIDYRIRLVLLLVGMAFMPVASVFATTINATRDLPEQIETPGSVPVALSIQIDGDLPNGIIVKEYIPDGWQINTSSPSHSSFDPATRLMEWVLLGGAVSQGTVVTYELQIPADETGIRFFQGYVLYNDTTGTPRTIETGGDPNTSTFYQNLTLSRSLPQTYDSPAYLDVTLSLDAQGLKPNGLIIEESIPTGLELVSSNPTHSAYNSATGLIKWILVDQEITPRTIAYRVQLPGGVNSVLSFSGILKYNDPAGQAVTSSANGDSAVSFAGTTQQITGTRYLPETITAGSTAEIALGLFVGGTAPTGLIVKETIPSGWNITGSQPTHDTFDAATGEIKWLFSGTDVGSKTISYTVSAPGDAAGSQTFSGELLYNDVTQAEQTASIVGDSLVGTKTVLPGDVSGDDIINMADAIISLQAISNISIQNIYRNADVNSDGKIGLKETIYILQKVSGLR